MLERERERATLAEAELAILKRQLNREKKTFENASVFIMFISTLYMLCMYILVGQRPCRPGVYIHYMHVVSRTLKHVIWYG